MMIFEASSAQAGEMSPQLQQFIADNGPKVQSQEVFSLENPRLLRTLVDGRVWIRLGAMVAYDGSLQFERESSLRHGVLGFVKKALTGEMSVLAEAKGKGTLYLADNGKYVTLLKLENDTICVQGTDLLAFEESLDYDIHIMKNVAGIMAGGMFYVKISGSGYLAITSLEVPLILPTSAEHPITTDPSCTVAWAGNILPEIRTDITFKSFIGKGGGESFQMRFSDKGFVIIQAGASLSSIRMA